MTEYYNLYSKRHEPTINRFVMFIVVLYDGYAPFPVYKNKSVHFCMKTDKRSFFRQKTFNKANKNVNMQRTGPFVDNRTMVRNVLFKACVVYS